MPLDDLDQGALSPRAMSQALPDQSSRISRRKWVSENSTYLNLNSEKFSGAKKGLVIDSSPIHLHDANNWGHCALPSSPWSVLIMCACGKMPLNGFDGIFASSHFD